MAMHCCVESFWEMMMATAKEQISELAQKQPDDSSYDEIIRELAFQLGAAVWS